MKHLAPIAAVVFLAAGAGAQQTSIAPSPTPARATAATGSRGATRTRTAAPGSSKPRTTPTRVAPVAPDGASQARVTTSSSSAPLGNSKVEVTGNPQHAGQPSDDKPMLPIATVPNALGLRSGTPIRVQLKATADSGRLRNGDTVEALLAAPLGGLPKGTPVQLAVVQASPAGFMVSYGELSLQVTAIGRYNILSDIVTALGKEGKKEIADAAPQRGTEAEFAAGQEFSFPVA